MKVKMQKCVLLDALEKMNEVSTKAILPVFDFSGRVTIEVEDKQVVFSSSNGALEARWTVTEKEDANIVDDSTPGICTVDSIKIRDCVEHLKTESTSSLVSLDADASTVKIKAVGSRKKFAQLPTDPNHHKIDTEYPSKGEGHIFEYEWFSKAIRTVAPFCPSRQYKPLYSLALFHWLPDQKTTRVVCGDGMLFAIYAFPQDVRDKTKKECSRLIPVDQLLVMEKVLEGSTQINFLWKKKDQVYISAENSQIEMRLKGIPDLQYIAYANHAYQFEKAKAIADIEVENLNEGVSLCAALRNKEQEAQGQFNKCYIIAPNKDNNMEFILSDGNFKGEYEVPVNYYNIDDQAEINLEYAVLFLDSVSKACKHKYLRFYFVDDAGMLNVRETDLSTEKDENGVPKIKENEDGSCLSFFFTSVK